MNRFWYNVAFFLILYVGVGNINISFADSPEQKLPIRIISMAPSITETLFALGLGDKVVGVTTFCSYPPEAKKKKRVGGYFDPNYEVITMLSPDLIILLPEHEVMSQHLKEMGLSFLVVHNRTVSEILDTINVIGKVCGAEKRAQEMIAEIRTQIQTIRRNTQNLPRPRIIVTIERTYGSGSITNVCIAGEKTLYNELVSIAGGENPYKGLAIEYPVLSAEGVIHLKPDIIIELIPDMEHISDASIISEWKSISGIPAAKNNRIYIIRKDYAVVPGPRFILFLEDIARIIHPEIRWTKE